MTSTSPKADPQEVEVNSGNVSIAAPRYVKVSEDLRPKGATGNYRILPTFLSAAKYQ